jgi:predicted RNA-binding protein with PIN domain
MATILVVDAYNVIHDWWSPGDRLELGMLRDRLLSDMATYAAMQQVRTIVVFDAHQMPTKGVQETHNGVEVHYSAADETADTVIERLCFQMSDAGDQVTVATSDRVQALVVFGKGVYRLSARNLRKEVDRSHREAREAVKTKKRQEKTMRLEHTLDAETRAKLDKMWRGEK